MKKASEVITELNELIAVHGDCNVELYDYEEEARCSDFETGAKTYFATVIKNGIGFLDSERPVRTVFRFSGEFCDDSVNVVTMENEGRTYESQ